MRKKSGGEMVEWEKYDFDINGNDAVQFDEVTHIAHTKNACRIIEDGKIRSSLVYDKSKLNTHRVSVTWFSANTWGLGSIYGTTKFSFDWKSIIAGKKPYWVEVITSYRPHAFRILFASEPPAGSIAVPYDPKTAKGPLKFRKGIWYRHKAYCSEFLLDSDVGISEAKEINFERHNLDRCRFGKSSCPDKGVSHDQSVAKVSAFLLANRGRILKLADQLTIDVKGTRRLHSNIDIAFCELADLLQRLKYKGYVPDADAGTVKGIVESAISLFSQGNVREARKTISVLSSETGLYTAFKAIVFELSGADIMLGE
jgi:hypothetical protein